MDALQEVIAAGDTSQLSRLLQGVSWDEVNIPIDEEGTTLLHLAANSDDPTSLLILLDHGANIEWQNAEGFTALHVAALWGRERAVRLLLEEGADPAICDEDELLPVDYARNEGHTECVQLLEQWGMSHEGGNLPSTEMSMAETFVSMFMDNLSQQTMAPDSPTLQTLALSPPTTPTPSSPNPLLTSFRELLISEDGRLQGVRASIDDTISERSELYTTAMNTPENTPSLPLSDSSPLPFDHPHESSTTPGTMSDTAGASMSPTLLDCSYAASITVPIPPSLHKLTNSDLRERLVHLGEQPGPITNFTRPAYLTYLAKLEAGGVRPQGHSNCNGYKYELALVLNGTTPIPDFSSLESKIFQPFRNPHPPVPSSTSPPSSPLPTLCTPRRARDKRAKCHFNYLLLDPRKTQGLKAGVVSDLDVFRRFVESVFYIGKGKNARSLQHLKDANECLTQGRKKQSSKLRHILDIWSAGYGVVSLHVFYNTTAEEAFTREACMIDAIGLGMLTNVVRGQPHGGVVQWSPSRKRHFGVYLLHKALRAYLIDPPQQIYQTDL